MADTDQVRYALNIYLRELDGSVQAIAPFVEEEQEITPLRVIDIHITLNRVEAARSLVQKTLDELR